MQLVVISPEGEDPREPAVVSELFAAGLERYHVRKPSWSHEKLEGWLRSFSADARAKMITHQHHDLTAPLGLRGIHFRDDSKVGRVVPNPPPREIRQPNEQRVKDNAPYLSRSCHDLTTLRSALGYYDSVFFSPIFPSLSKPGYGPRADFPTTEVISLLSHRTPAERRTAVVALGGITAITAPRAIAFGFDGVAVLGAIWQAADPVRAFAEIQNFLVCHAA
jgi:thiamine-phosphate pyrophosphorylase